MSYLNNIYDKPQINLVDGVVTDESIINLGFQIETAFENVGDIFGNLYGNGLNTAIFPRYSNSISSSLGDMKNVSPEEPFGIIFDTYSQVFNGANQRKDFLLDLIPIEGQEQTTISIVASNSITYSWVTNEELLKEEGDFTTKGRIISFYIVPDGNFSVEYKGTYPSFNSDGYMPNVYPSPDLIEQGEISRPTITLMPSGRYRVLIPQINKNSYGDIFGDNLVLKYNSLIEPFVSPAGDQEVPREFVNAWIKFGNSYTTIHAKGIYLLSEQEIEIDTDDPIDVNLDTIVFSISNVTISDMIREIYVLTKEHNHDNGSIIPPIDHDYLMNLIPLSEKDSITYSKSLIKNNDHPEYLHREGYRADDPGTYNNSLLGDLLISSTDEDEGYENVLDSSYRLVFGSPSEGISLRLLVEAGEPKVLALKTTNDGLFIDSGTINDVGKEHRALRLNTHELFTYGIDDSGNIIQNLSLSSSSGKTLILNINDPSEFADMQMNKLFSKDIDLTGALNIIAPDGSLSIGDVVFTPGALSGLTIAGDIHFTGNLLLDNMTTTVAEIEDLTITEVITIEDSGTSIEFSDSGKSSYIRTTKDGQIEVLSTDEVRVKTPIILDGVSGIEDGGRINGLSFMELNSEGDLIGRYSSTFISSPGGGHVSPSTVATFMELYHDESSDLEQNHNGLWLIRSTDRPQIEGGIKYSWKSNEPGSTRVDTLTSWPRSKLAAGFGDFYSIKVDLSNLSEKEGVKFGDFNHIFVTGEGGNCPTGLMVLESLGGVAMVASGADPSDCKNVTYSSLIAGDIQSRGSVSAEHDLSAGGNVSAGKELSGETLVVSENSQIYGDERVFGNSTIDGDLFILGESDFNSNVGVSGRLKVTNETEVGNLKVIGVSEFGEISRFKSAVALEESLSVNGLSQFNGNVDLNSRTRAKDVYTDDLHTTTIDAADLITASGGLLVTSNAEINGSLIANSNADIAGTLTVDSSLSASGVSSTSDLNVAGRTTLSGEVSTSSTVLLNGTGDDSLVVNMPSQFTKDAIFGRKLTASSAEIHGNINISGSIDSNIINGTSITAEDSLTARVLNCDAASFSDNVRIEGSLSIGQSSPNPVSIILNGGITATGSVSASGDLFATGNVFSGSGYTAEHGSYSSMHDLVVGGNLNVTGRLECKEEGSFRGDLKALSNLDVGRLITIGSAVRIEMGDGRIAIGEVNGDESNDPGQLSVSYGTFKWLDGVTVGSELPIPTGEDNAVAFLGIREQAISITNYLRHSNMHVNGMAIFSGQVIIDKDLWVNRIRTIDSSGIGGEEGWVDLIAKEAHYAAD